MRALRVLLTSLTAFLLMVSGLLLPVSAWASYGYGPQRYKNGNVYGQGIFFAPYDFKVYAAPSEAAQVLDEFHWQHGDGSTLRVYSARTGQLVDPKNVFFCFYPQLDVAMVAAIADNDKGWVEVVYDQESHATGWVKLWPDQPAAGEKAGAAAAASEPAEDLPTMEAFNAPPHFGHYLTWMEFMKNNAKAHGIYWLTGVSSYNRSVRMMDKDDAPLLDVMAIRDLKVRHLRGNWMLVEVLDFNRDTPIGWLRWRDNDGNLLVFPNFNNQHVPITVTSF